MICAVAAAATPETGQLDASPSLFTVMAALNAAGYSADLSSPNNHPLRAAIQAELAKRNAPSLAAIPSLTAIKDFFERHRKRTDTLELSQYISFALALGMRLVPHHTRPRPPPALRSYPGAHTRSRPLVIWPVHAPARSCRPAGGRPLI